MNLNEVIKNTFINLSKDKKVATPNEYKIEFCKEAKRQGVFIKECEDGLKRYIEKLPKKLQNDIYNKKISTESDLLIFLISELNRVKLQENREFTDTLSNLTLHILKAITLFKDRESSELANTTINRLKDAKNSDLVAMRDKWKAFDESFNVNTLNELSKEIELPHNNIDLNPILKELLKYIKELKISTEKEQIIQNYKNISSLLVKSTIPSITSNLNTSIITLDKKLKKEPELIVSSAMQQEILKLIKRGKELDREEFLNANRKAQDVLMNLIRLSNEGNFKQRISDVKAMIGTTDKSNIDMKKMELMNIVVSLEHSMNSFSDIIDSKQEDIHSLQDKVKELELKLNKLEVEKEKFQSNFASKVFEIPSIQKLEGSYRKGVNPYLIIIIRLDNYAHILNTFGQKTWNAIVHTFKKIVQKGIQDIDVLNQMDVRTFLLFLNSKDLNESLEFCDHIRDALSHSTFVYKGQNIESTISVGVSNRDEDENFEYAIKKSMDRLNIAKKHQNTIVHQNNMASFLKI